MKFYFAIAMSTIGILSFLQAQEIKVSEDIPLKNADSYELIGKLKNRYIILQERPNAIEVQGFNNKLELDWEKPLELDKRNSEMIGVDFYEDYFYFFYQFKAKGKTVLKVHQYDPGANLRDSLTISDYGNLFFTPNFEIIRSEDRSKVMVYFIERMKEINVLVFDIPTMSIVTQQKIVPEDFDFNFEFTQTVVNNKGEFAFIIGRDNFRSKRKQHYYEIYHFQRSTDQFKVTKIGLDNFMTYDVFFSFDNLNDNLVAGGLYAEKSLSRSEGYFFLSIPIDDPDSYTLYFEDFEDDFLNTLLGKDKDKKAKGLPESSIQEIVLRRDGGIILIGERNRQFQRKSISPSTRAYYDPSGRYLVDYYYDDLFVFSIHPNGEKHWSAVLPKKQFSQDDFGAFSSFFLFKSTTSLRLLFNDEIKNENTVSEYMLLGDGSYQRNSVMNTQNLTLKLRFRDALQINNNEILIPSEKKNRIKLVSIQY